MILTNDQQLRINVKGSIRSITPIKWDFPLVIGRFAMDNEHSLRGFILELNGLL